MAGLMDAVEIVIKKELILSYATKLDSIAEGVSQKKITCNVSNSKGKTANSVNSLIEELNTMGTVLSCLMRNNAANVRQIAEQFSAIDAEMASKYEG